jgi:hypothetical protein
MDVRHALFLGFSNKRLGILGALCHIHRYCRDHPIHARWLGRVGRRPAMTGNVPFLMKDVVLLAASFYLLKHDVGRV